MMRFKERKVHHLNSWSNWRWNWMGYCTSGTGLETTKRTWTVRTCKTVYHIGRHKSESTKINSCWSVVSGAGWNRSILQPTWRQCSIRCMIWPSDWVVSCLETECHDPTAGRSWMANAAIKHQYVDQIRVSTKSRKTDGKLAAGHSWQQWKLDQSEKKTNLVPMQNYWAVCYCKNEKDQGCSAWGTKTMACVHRSTVSWQNWERPGGVSGRGKHWGCQM